MVSVLKFGDTYHPLDPDLGKKVVLYSTVLTIGQTILYLVALQQGKNR